MNSFYLIDATDGQLRRADLTPIANANEMLRNIARSEPVLIRDFPAKGYAAKISSQQLVLGRKLDSVRLNTHFAPITLPDGTARVHAVFYDNRISIHQSLDFTPPPGHEMWFFTIFDIDVTGRLFMQREPFMCWYVVGENIYRPPFSNTYEDGRICMGDGWRAEHSRVATLPMQEAFEAAVTWLQTTNSVNDLRPSVNPIPLLLWTPGEELTPDYQGWEDHRYRDNARTVSNDIFDKFFESIAI
jgi:hypothetical protein